MTTYRLTGQIIQKGTQQGVADLRVEAWDHEGQTTSLIAVAVTGAEGDFLFALDDTYLEEHFQDRRPTITFRVFAGTAQLLTAEVLWKVSDDTTSVRFEVDPEATHGTASPASSVVYGMLRNPSGAPIASTTVRAFDQGLGAEHTLGEDTTDARGRYRITYTAADRVFSGKVHPDLVVRAYSEEDAVLAESPRGCHAPATVRVDVTVGGEYRGPSEFEALEAQIAASIVGFDLASATDAHVDRLACSTRVEHTMVADRVAAAALAGSTGVSHAVLYALLRAGFSSSRRDLLRTSPASQQQALEIALDKNILPAGTSIEDAMTALRTATVAMAFDTPSETATGNLGDLLAMTLSTQGVQEEFLHKYLSHTGTIEEFWTWLPTQTSFAASGLVASLQLTLQFGALGHYHFPLIAELQARTTASTITSFRDLAAYSESDWTGVIETVRDGQAVGYPVDIPGANAGEKKANYAKSLKHTMELAFPSAAMAADILLAGGAGSSDLGTFFANNPTFEIGKQRLGAYVIDTPAAFAGLTDPDGTRVRIDQIERLFKITPRYEDVKRFLDDGFLSAQVIQGIGRTAFVQKYESALGGSDAAGLVYDRAVSLSHQAVALQAKYGPAHNPTSAYVLPDPASPAAGSPSKTADWASLFGSPDACACDHCASVLGPAAYFVDLLEFLGRYDSTLTKEGTSKWKALDVLLGRVTGAEPSFPGRPDLAAVVLSCDNTDVAVPYVDLVNEILEHAVAPAQLSPAPTFPDHIATTGTAIDLAAHPEVVAGEEEAHTAAYKELASAVHPFALPYHAWASEARTYLTHLGVPRYALMQTLQSTAFVPSAVDIAAERLGLSPRERNVITGSWPSADPFTIEQYWGLTGEETIADLTGVPLFMSRSELSFDEVVELLDTTFIRRYGEAPTLVSASGSDGCDPDQMTISGLSSPTVAFAAIHRFLRLQRRTGYSIRELDAFFTVSGPEIDDDFVQRLAAVERFRAEPGVSGQVLASWFGDMDTRRRDGGRTASFYEQVFQNRAVKNPPDSLFDVGGGGGLVSDRPDVVRGALRISGKDLALLTDSTVSQIEVGTACEFASSEPSITVSDLSKLHRIVTFAQALGLSIKDWLILKRLWNIALPFTVDGIERFVDVASRVRKAGIKPVDLLYLFSSFVSPSATLVLSDVEIDVVLDALFEGQVTRYVAGEASEARDNLIQQTLAAAFGLTMKPSGLLLTSVLTPTGTVGTPLIAPFRLTVTDPFPDDPVLAEEDRWAQRAAYRHLHKVTTLVKKLGMSAGELARFTDETVEPLLFDFDALPRSVTSPSAELFEDWLQITDLCSMRPTLPGDTDALLPLFPPPGTNLTAERASEVTGWPLADIEALVDETHGLGLDFSGLRGTVRTLLRLRDVFAVLKRLGVTAAKALRWVDTNAPLPGASPPAITADMVADEIVQTAKAKYTDAAWTSVAPPLRNTLRDAQRGTLVAYLVAKNGYKDSNELFGRLLVDVEGCSCQLTSRLKQAIGSVQTFAQRALLGLIPDVPLPAEAATEWAWRKNYRVWEANRRIFLYPENWLDPELRSGKSPFFTALEGELRQRELTSDTAELAIKHYVEKLVEVDRLEVVAMAHQAEEDDADHPAVDLLHVIGRTNLTPHKYFYRRRVNASYWTPWESIDLDIEGNHLLLEVIDQRLHLFWPLIQEKPDANQPKSGPDQAGASAKKHLEIQLAWSEYKSGTWTGKRVSLGNPVTISPVVHRYWLSFVLKRWHATFGGTFYSIECLFNPVQWSPTYPRLLRLGGFSFDACGTLVGHNRAKGFSPPVNASVQQLIASALGLYLWEGEDDVVELTLPSPSTRVYQDAKEFKTDKEIAKAATPPSIFEEGASLNHPLNLPILLDGEREGRKVFMTTPGTYRVLSPHRISDKGKDVYDEADVLFYKDAVATFLGELESDTTLTLSAASKIQPGGASHLDLFGSSGLSPEVRGWSKSTPQEFYIPHLNVSRGYRFSAFYHPYACAFLSQLNRSGVAGLLDWSTQLLKLQLRSEEDLFVTRYTPNEEFVKTPYPIDDVDFSFKGAYSLYNWELFFHAPFLIATRLMQNQRFGEAQQWLHYIFDPTPGSTESKPKRFWKVRPFYENTDLSTIQEELETLAEEAQGPTTKLIGSFLGLLSGKASEVMDFDAQVRAWEAHPFDVHLVARMRPLAYQKAVVMTYVENLIAWGDQLFRRDTIESINEATQLYILAADLLGPRPRRVRRPGQETEAKTYQELSDLGMDAFSDPLIAAENLGRTELFLPLGQGKFANGRKEPPPPDLRTLYFCVPADDTLQGLWDTVADRLFKLRHCMSIDGVVQKLPLFEPPIDPALLVQAVASGVDLQSALADLDAPSSHYRFSVLYGKAMDLCAGVTAFGGALLSALEKRDAEGLARLRSTQEIEMLALVRDIKERQVKEAETSLAGLEKTLEVTQIRRDHYAGLKTISLTENISLSHAFAAGITTSIAQGIAIGAEPAHMVPTFVVGAGGALASPISVTSFGGSNVGSSIQAASQALTMVAGILRDGAALTGTLAGYERRRQDWDLQIALATKEIQQIQKQILAARIRLAIAERELDNHAKQAEHAKAAGEYLRDKFTSVELYDWMLARISTVYFQSYQLAYDVAKRAERCFRFELGVEVTKFVTFGYWDNLKQGLLAGERLQHDLRRMEVAYLEQNRRELEITKHISLALLDPEALMTLRETGSCALSLTEKLFDLDYPGHFFRRIKAVSVTVPAVSGPYTGVSCTLRLEETSTRIKSTLPEEAYARQDGSETDERFRDWPASTEAIVTSGGQSDGGLFESNLRDERYLPFEGLGVIGDWTITLPRGSNGFDIATVTDVVLHLRYTARDGGDILRGAVRDLVIHGNRTGKRVFSAREDFPDAWASFMNPAQGAAEQVLSFPLTPSMFPFIPGNKGVKITKAWVYARWNGPERYVVEAAPKPLVITLSEPAVSGLPSPLTPLTLDVLPGLTSGDMGRVLLAGEEPYQLDPSTWTIHATSTAIAQLEEPLFTGFDTGKGWLNDTLQDMWLLVEYEQDVPSWV